MNVCSLFDQKFTGRLLKDELLHVFKIMGATVNARDIEALSELLPDNSIERDGSFNYRDVQWLLQNHSNKHSERPMGASFDFNDFSPVQHGYGGVGGRSATLNPVHNSSAGFHTMSHPHRIDHSSTFDYNYGSAPNFARSIPTPSGLMVATPYAAYDAREPPRFSEPLPGYTHSAAASAHEKVLAGIVDRTAVAVEEKGRSWGGPFSLMRQFEVNFRHLLVLTFRFVIEYFIGIRYYKLRACFSSHISSHA